MTRGSQPSASDPLKPELSVLCKLASIAAHVEEMLSAKGHAYDRIALQQLLDDAEVKSWMKQMGPYVPVKR